MTYADLVAHLRLVRKLLGGESLQVRMAAEHVDFIIESLQMRIEFTDVEPSDFIEGAVEHFTNRARRAKMTTLQQIEGMVWAGVPEFIDDEEVEGYIRDVCEELGIEQ
jgi:hypothetical protein